MIKKVDVAVFDFVSSVKDGSPLVGKNIGKSDPRHFATVAFAAGFASIRQFNDTIREVYDVSPTQLRGRGCLGRTDPRRQQGVCGVVVAGDKRRSDRRRPTAAV